MKIRFNSSSHGRFALKSESPVVSETWKNTDMLLEYRAHNLRLDKLQNTTNLPLEPPPVAYVS